MQVYHDPADCKNIHELREWFGEDYNEALMGMWDAAELQRLAVSIYSATESANEAGIDHGWESGYEAGQETTE